MNEVLAPEVVCAKCGRNQKIGFNFCTNCGTRNLQNTIKETKKDSSRTRNLTYLAVYTFLTLALLILSGLSGESFDIILVWTICFAAVDYIFAYLQPEVWRLFYVSSIKLLPLLVIIIFCFISGIVVSYSMGHLNLLLFENIYLILPAYYETPYPLLFAIIFTAFCPALFEELAFRGFIYNNLKSISSVNAAIFGSTFLFGLVHFSLISLIWILPFGLLLAYYRKKYSTILYGIIGHFVHNATVILIEFYEIFDDLNPEIMETF